MSSPNQTTFANEDEAFAAALALDDDAPKPEAVEPEAGGGQAGEEPAPQPENGDGQPGDQPDGGTAVDTAENPQQPAPEDEIVASLPEAARAYVEGLRNRVSEFEANHQSMSSELARVRNDYASMAGKLPSLQRKLAEYEKREKQAPPQSPAPASTPGSSGQGAAEQTLDAYLKSEEWQEYAQLFPKEAAVWERGQRIAIEAAERIARSEAQRAVQEVTSRYEPVIQDVATERAERARQEAIRDLASEHPDWQQIDSDPRFSKWFDEQWLPSQLDVVQTAFENEGYSKRQLANPAFVKRLLTEFKDAHGIARGEQRPTGGSAAPAAPARHATPARLAVSASPSIRSTPPSRVAIGRMTPDQAFQAALNSDD